MTATPAPPPALSTVARAVIWCGFLIASHVGLVAAGNVLPVPPGPWNGGDTLAWLPTADIAQLSFGVLRLAALVVVWYLALLTALVLLARVARFRPVALLARAIAMPWARRLVSQALGAGVALTVAGGLVPGAAGSAGAAPRPAPVTMQADHADAGPVTMRAVDDEEPMTMRVVPEVTAPAAHSVGGAIARSTVTMHTADERPEAPATWTIGPGDHLWHVAEHTLRGAWSREPTEAEVGRYWTALVDHNRSRLAVAADPDLVYPGQVFELPPTPPGR